MSHCHAPLEQDAAKGAYIALDPHEGLADGVIIFDRRNAETVKQAAFILSVQGIAMRLVEVRNFDLFMKQDKAYRETVLRQDLIAIKAADKNTDWLERIPGTVVPADDACSAANAVKELIGAKNSL